MLCVFFLLPTYFCVDMVVYCFVFVFLWGVMWPTFCINLFVYCFVFIFLNEFVNDVLNNYYYWNHDICVLFFLFYTSNLNWQFSFSIILFCFVFFIHQNWIWAHLICPIKNMLLCQTVDWSLLANYTTSMGTINWLCRYK